MWWRCADGSLVHLDYIFAANKRDGRTPEEIRSGRVNEKPSISFHRAEGPGWLDEYPTQMDRDIAFERLAQQTGASPEE